MSAVTITIIIMIMIILTIIIILCSKEFYLVIDATKEMSLIHI